jgi:hypothetical protein
MGHKTKFSSCNSHNKKHKRSCSCISVDGVSSIRITLYRVTALILFRNIIYIYVERSTIFTQAYILFPNGQVFHNNKKYFEYFQIYFLISVTLVWCFDLV